MSIAATDAQNAPRSDDYGTVAGRPGLWRLLCLATAFAAGVILLVAFFQTRSTNNLDASSAGPLTRTVTTQVRDLPSGEGITVRSLGAPAQISGSTAAAGEPLVIADTEPTIVGLFDGDTLIGLAAASADVVEISPDSTAAALLLLAPAILHQDPTLAAQTVTAIRSDPGFIDLVEAIAVQPSLTEPNEPRETALASILDRLRAAEPVPDQGCDSVLDASAFAAAGTCVQTTGGGFTITNEQDRWALAIAPGSGWSEACAVVPPTGASLGPITIEPDTCNDPFVLAAPGPVDDTIDGASDAVAAAAMLTAIDDYTIPLLQAVGGAAPELGQLPVIEANPAAILNRIESLNGDAVDASQPLTMGERHRTMVAIATQVLDDGELVGLIGGQPGLARDLLALYERVGADMLSTRSSVRWTASGAALVSAGASQ